jgi:hypothetical protein
MNPPPSDYSSSSNRRCHVCDHCFRFWHPTHNREPRPRSCPLCDAPIRRHMKLTEPEIFGIYARCGGKPKLVRGRNQLPEYWLFNCVTNEAEVIASVAAILAVDAVALVDRRVQMIETTYASEEARRKGWTKSEEVLAELAALELVRRQAESGLLRWRIEELGRRVVDMVSAEHRHHRHIRRVRYAAAKQPP